MLLPLVTLEHVSYQYGDGTMALNDITFSIEQGKKIALIGNNGAGKSTLFLLLNGIIKPSKGFITYKGKKINYNRKEIKQLRQRVGIVFQNPDSQLFSSSVYEDIMFGPKNLGLPLDLVKQKVQEVMLLTETESLKDKPPHFLSIGQKKRVSIAGVIAMEPELMILDEPTAGLDPYYSRKIMELLGTLHNRDRTIILSTHNVDLAYEWADEVIVLHDGEILSQGEPNDVFQQINVLQKSHLEKPWMMEVYEKLIESTGLTSSTYPSTKTELFDLMSKLLADKTPSK
ncbi:MULTISPECIES: energy-coupling factor ABC transporter ATP-binding protein [Bacillaceae]|uniref:energy-coupling factor ABC transporter ATP-binding protein n=1 Tax=Bacillaceae TaxID=186817 RepID=UPI000BFCF3E6|nr:MULTISPECIES: ATP-binding cassette domain-containing protein [Bacillaceae]PGT84403.1 energy-coupling factor ABC transporter ATP-binding protein [Bacillus sp. AFS040349]UGB33013.1 ATP-binding cassette domain-containing protein [Metabacillus sp. B2-18]